MAVAETSRRTVGCGRTQTDPGARHAAAGPARDGARRPYAPQGPPVSGRHPASVLALVDGPHQVLREVEVRVDDVRKDGAAVLSPADGADAERAVFVQLLDVEVTAVVGCGVVIVVVVVVVGHSVVVVVGRTVVVAVVVAVCRIVVVAAVAVAAIEDEVVVPVDVVGFDRFSNLTAALAVFDARKQPVDVAVFSAAGCRGAGGYVGAFGRQFSALLQGRVPEYDGQRVFRQVAHQQHLHTK